MSFLKAGTYFSIELEDGNEKLRFFLILLYSFSLPFNLLYSTVIFLILTAVTLLDLKKENLKRIPKRFWLFQAVFYFGVAGYFYSSHKNAAGFLLERQLTIFLLPIILPVAIKITPRKIRMVLDSLTLSCFLSVIYLFVSMFLVIHDSLHLPFLKTAFSGAFFNHSFSEPIGIHAGYLSLYVSMSIIYLISSINKNKSFVKKAVLVTFLFVLFFGFIFLASRNTIIATFFILLFIFPLFKINHKLQYISVLLGCLVIIFLLVKNVPYLKERFSIELISDIRSLNNGKFINYSLTEPRIERWKCAAELIKQSPVFGYGTGDEVEMLKIKYADKGLFISYIENFNAHNEYLSIWIKNGLIGLILFLSLFYYYCQLAIRKRDFLYSAFLVLLLIGFYTENILDANKGIVFFALFNTLFGYNLLNTRAPE